MMRTISATACRTVLILACLTLSATAVTPPAPAQWYDRYEKGNRPAQIPQRVPEQTTKLAADMAQVNANRPVDPEDTDNLLLILVTFSDHPADTLAHPPSAYDDLIFSHGVLSTGSLVEYYEEISYGAFSPAGTVTVWIEAPEPYNYYTDGDYGFGGYPNNSQGLLEDCVGLLDPVLDFSQFDNNGDGFAEGIFLVHAGPGAEETGDPNDIWSHAWYYSVATDDGVSTGRYSVEPEELYDGTLIPIGVFCHEYGHVLGMPDLYDTDGSSEGIGIYCLMAGGSWGALPGNPERPTHMCAEMKYRLGWLVPLNLTASSPGLAVLPSETNPICYRIDHPSDPTEYFLLEYRARIGFDSLMRGDGGLAIWHVDEAGWQSDETHRYVSLEQADGNGDLERDYGTGNRHPRTNRGDAGDLFPGAVGNTHFSWSSHPSSMSYDAQADILTATNLEQYGNDSLVADIYPNPATIIHRVEHFVAVDTIGAHTDLDYEADSGEVVDLILELAVDGGAGEASASLSTTDSRVTIIDQLATFADVPHGGYADNTADPFRFEVLSASKDSAVTFTLSLDLGGKQSYQQQFRVNLNRSDILLVLDDNYSNWTDRVVEAMHRSGHSFDTWKIDDTHQIAINVLLPYHAVIWTNGSYFGRRTGDPDYEYCLNSDEKAAISEYLGIGGRMALFSQDYMYDYSDILGSDLFLHDTLHVGDYDLDTVSTEVNGSSFLSGFVGYAPEWTFYDYTDRVPNPQGAAVVVMQDGDDGIATAISCPGGDPVLGDNAVFFSTYALERFDDVSLDDLLPSLCEWLLTNKSIDVPMPIYPKNDTLVEGESIDLLWTASEGAIEYHYEVATDEGFTNIVASGVASGTSTTITDSLPDAAYCWRVSAIPSSGPATTHGPYTRFHFVFSSPYVCGDVDGNGSGPDISDLVYLVTYMFGGGPAPSNMSAADVNGDGTGPDISDLVYLVSYMFQAGDPLNCP